MAELNQYEQLMTGNYIYQENYTRWKYLYESFVGGQTYKNGSYLNRYQLETDSEYVARIAATPLQNHCAGIVSVYNSFLFREEPERDYGSIANLPELADFIKDVDYEGRSMDHFMREVSVWNKVFGHAWVLVTKPNIGATTRADEQAVMLRPYLSLLTPLVVMDWTWERDFTGRYKLSYLKYVEDVNGNVQTIKEWTEETITTSTVDTKNRQVQEFIVEDNQLGVIPAIISYNERSIVRGVGVSAINDIADAQRFIYNCTSEADQSMRLDSHPSLVKTAETQAGVGAGAIIQMPENLDPSLKPYVLDFAGASIDNIYTSINNTIESIDKMAAVGSVRGTQSKTMSGIAMETEFQILNAKLATMADNMELTEEQVWRLWCMYQQQPYDMCIEYPESFNLRDSAKEIDELRIAAQTNPTDPRVRAGIDARVLDWLDLDEDELAAIADPTLLDLSTITESGDIPNAD